MGHSMVVKWPSKGGLFCLFSCQRRQFGLIIKKEGGLFCLFSYQRRLFGLIIKKG